MAWEVGWPSPLAALAQHALGLGWDITAAGEQVPAARFLTAPASLSSFPHTFCLLFSLFLFSYVSVSRREGGEGETSIPVSGVSLSCSVLPL